MQAKQNRIRIHIGSNPKLAEFFSRLPDGEKWRAEIEAVKVSATGDSVESTLHSIAPEGMKLDSKEEEKAIDPAPDEPVAIDIVSE
jgi:hypothetical protein